MPPEIYVYVYDLTKLNRILQSISMEVLHTSVVIDGEIEYYFGFKRHGTSGIDTNILVGVLPAPMSGTLKKRIRIGHAKFSSKKITNIVQQMRLDHKWLSNSYNICHNNCHSFSYALINKIMHKRQISLFPSEVFNCPEFAGRIYDGLICHFIDRENPPTYLNAPPVCCNAEGELAAV
jgi:hypothetical protein